MTLKELNEYIPHCIICGKDMHLKISGSLTKPSHFHSSGNTTVLYSARTSIKLKSFLKDGLLHFKDTKDANIAILVDPDTNKVIEGMDLLKALSSNWIYLNKNCQTCDCNIATMYTNKEAAKLENFPPLKLTSEKLHYTMKRGKTVFIMKSFYDDATLLGSRTNVLINGKPIKEINLDLSRYKNLEQLNNRLATIMVFQ